MSATDIVSSLAFTYLILVGCFLTLYVMPSLRNAGGRPIGGHATKRPWMWH